MSLHMHVYETFPIQSIQSPTYSTMVRWAFIGQISSWNRTQWIHGCWMPGKSILRSSNGVMPNFPKKWILLKETFLLEHFQLIGTCIFTLLYQAKPSLNKQSYESLNTINWTNMNNILNGHISKYKCLKCNVRHFYYDWNRGIFDNVTLGNKNCIVYDNWYDYHSYYEDENHQYRDNVYCDQNSLEHDDEEVFEEKL